MLKRKSEEEQCSPKKLRFEDAASDYQNMCFDIGYTSGLWRNISDFQNTVFEKRRLEEYGCSAAKRLKPTVCQELIHIPQPTLTINTDLNNIPFAIKKNPKQQDDSNKQLILYKK